MSVAENQDIAIVGMAGIYPKAPDIDVFWSNVLNKVDAVTEAPEGWLGNGWIYDPDSTEVRRIYTNKGGFLHELSRFDARAYGTMPLSVEGGQPDQFLTLKIAHDALIDAGLEPGKFDGSRTGVILGLAVHAHRANTNGIQQYWFEPQMRETLATLFPEIEGDRIEAALDLMRKQLPKIAPDSLPGLIPNILTGRIANRLDLMGPNYIIDAACSSSLITIDLAMNELKAGNADIMLAGGVNTTTSPLVYGVFCSVDALSRTGKIRPFGREASGTVLGEGAGIVVLKRLADALDAGDRIHAVIKGAGQSSDGKSSGLMAPRREGAELAVRRAYANSGVDPMTIGLVEAHGTGISLGEKIEVDALRAVFGGRRGPVPTVPIGSVKSMIGHCIPASGSASVIKMAMALQHRVLPPTLAGEVNPETGLETTPFFVSEEPRPWIGSGAHPRRAAINAFGFGGINAHLILEESPVGRERDPTAAFLRPVPAIRTTEQVFAFAGADGAAILTALDGFEAPAPEAFAATAAELWAAADGPARLAIVAESPADLAKKIGAAQKALAKPGATSVKTRNGIYFEAAPVEGKTVFLFPGEMAQYPDMLREAALGMEGVRDWFGDIAALTETRRPVRLQDVIYPPENMMDDATRAHLDELMHQVDYGSEMVFAADQAICDALKTLGVAPNAMLGHSTGENAALIASGKIGLDRPAVCAMIADMNTVFDKVAESEAVPNGVLLTVAALDRAVLDRIHADFPNVHFTMDNCPNQAILFGEGTDIDALQAKVVAEGAVCTRLPISWGYHTEYVRPMAEGFRDLFANVAWQASDVTLWSCATAQPFPEDREAALETAVSQYVSPVRFTQAITNLYEDGHRIFVECGPNANLTAFVRDILGDRPHIAVEADNKRRGFLSQLRHVSAQLFAAGRTLDIAPLVNPAEGADAGTRRAASAAHLAAPALPSELAAFRLDGEAGDAIRALFRPEPAAAPAAAAAYQDPAAAAAYQATTAAGPAANGPAPAGAYQGAAPAGAYQTAPPAGADIPQTGGYGAATGDASSGDGVERIEVLDLAHFFDLPFAFRAYLMQGSPSLDALAPYLGRSELAEAEALLTEGARRVERWREWSLSRLAVKRAAAEMIAASAGQAPEANLIEILKDADGAPYLGLGQGSPSISIAHVGNAGIGAAGQPGVRIGVDYELAGRIRDTGSFLETILGPEEARRIAPAEDEITAIALWAVKEAAAKALGQGLQGRPQDFPILELDAATGAATLGHGSYRMAARLARVGDGVCAVAYLAAT